MGKVETSIQSESNKGTFNILASWTNSSNSHNFQSKINMPGWMISCHEENNFSSYETLPWILIKIFNMATGKKIESALLAEFLHKNSDL